LDVGLEVLAAEVDEAAVASCADLRRPPWLSAGPLEGFAERILALFP
jgi:hypothetical protein